jgi:hypothetical protein
VLAIRLLEGLVGNQAVDPTIGRTSTRPAGNADGSSGAGEISATLNNIRLTGTTVDVRSATGSASSEGGASVFDGGSFTNSLIGDNRVHVSPQPGQRQFKAVGSSWPSR